MHPSEPFPHFVDDYLAYLYEVLPGRASLDGVHLHDDLLEDLSRTAIDAHIRALSGFRRRLHQIEPRVLPAVEQVEHPIVVADLDARMHELEEIRTWERSPHLYAETLGTSLAGQTLFAYAPETERARRVVSKLRQVSRLVQAARDNVKECPGIFVKVALETWRGTLRFIEFDLPRAFSSLDDLHILGDLADASTEASTAIASYIAYLENDLAPRAKASFRLGRDKFERKLKLEQGVSLNAERLLTTALRELSEVQEEFRSAAGRLNGTDPIVAWRAAKGRHPGAGDLIGVAQAQLKDLAEFIQRQSIVPQTDGEQVVVAPSPEFYRWTQASMWMPGPFEAKPSRAYFYLTAVDRAWPAERQGEHLRDLNVPALWNLSMQEVYPGHFVQSQLLRKIDSKVRKSLLFAPATFTEGWAHYCGQMMLEVGFHRGDVELKVGQLADALARLSRVVVGIRLHCEDLSVEQGMRFFRDEAFLEEATARREAERGTFDPGYVASAIGRLMMLKLRSDYKAREGSRYTLRAFHDAILASGNAPFWAHRRLLLEDASDAVLE